MHQALTISGLALVSTLMIGGGSVGAATPMQQCGQEYQAAKAAGTLNGMAWTQFRTECSARLKAQPASTPVQATPATQTANPLNPAPAAPAVPAPPATTTATAPSATPTTSGASSAVTTGRQAFVARERQCGTEWRASKATLTAQTPGLTWPKYLSQCNARLKAAGK